MQEIKEWVLAFLGGILLVIVLPFGLVIFGETVNPEDDGDQVVATVEAWRARDAALRDGASEWDAALAADVAFCRVKPAEFCGF